MKRMNSKTVVLLIAIAVLLTVTVGGTVAYLAASTQPVVNVFTPGSVGGEIEETLEGQVKKNVTGRNTGNVDAYIRAKIVVTWQNSAGDVYPVMPVAGTDYTINDGTDKGWTKGNDGFYYYNGKNGDNGKVGAGASTGNLIDTCSPVEGKAPSGYTLHVEILAQAIQADGWPEDVDTAQKAFAEAAKPVTNN